MKIPNCENAVVAIEKLRDYALSEIHPVGKHKAKVFRSKLGLTADDAEVLRTILLGNACNENAVAGSQDPYGQRYTIDFIVKLNNLTAMIRSGWMIRIDENYPRLTTCYVL